MHLFFPDQESPMINILCGSSERWSQFGLSWLEIIQKYITMENDTNEITMKKWKNYNEIIKKDIKMVVKVLWKSSRRQKVKKRLC